MTGLGLTTLAGLPARLILIAAALSAMLFSTLRPNRVDVALLTSALFSISITLVRLVLLALLKLPPVLSLWLTVLLVVVVAHF